MTGSDWYDIRARAFFLMRGMTPPEEGTETLDDYTSRTAAWVAWNAVNSNVLNAIQQALEESHAKR
jgi:hypothetical protein